MITLWQVQDSVVKLCADSGTVSCVKQSSNNIRICCVNDELNRTLFITLILTELFLISKGLLQTAREPRVVVCALAAQATRGHLNPTVFCSGNP